MKIPFGKPILSDRDFKDVVKVLKSGVLVHGRKNNEFENLFRSYTNSKHAISVSSCTAGLFLLYYVLGIKKNDEVIVSSQTHAATALSFCALGAKPVFVDSEKNSGNIDVSKIEKHITKKTKAISIVHYLGFAAEIEKISKIAKKHNLFLIEDCALALGTTVNKKHVGLFGDAGVFSFYPIKHITTAEGGMIITKNSNLAKKLILAKSLGVNKQFADRKIPGIYDVVYPGLNLRMNEISSVLGLNQLKKFDSFKKIREKNYKKYLKIFSKKKEFETVKNYKKNEDWSYYAFPLILNKSRKIERNKLVNHLKKKNIGTSVYYPHPLPRLSYFKKKYKINLGNFLNAKKFSDQTIMLPIGPHINEKKIFHITKEIFSFIRKNK